MNPRRRGEALAGYGLLAPSFVGVVGFLLIPVVIVVGMSFTRYNLLSSPTWVGWENYRYIFTSPVFGNSLLVTVVFTATAIPLTIGLGLLLALGLNRKLPGVGLLRVVYVLPWVCAPLALGVVWKWLLHPSTGALNAVIGQRVEWLTSPETALASVVFVQVWANIGYVSLFFLAGLQQIPTQVYEAARLDGCGALRTVFAITLPLLRPTMFFVSVTSMIASFQVFDTVYAMTGGGPDGRTDVIASRIYSEAFVSLNLGRASAMSVVLFAILVAVTFVQQRYFRRRITYDMS